MVLFGGARVAGAVLLPTWRGGAELAGGARQSGSPPLPGDYFYFFDIFLHA